MKNTIKSFAMGAMLLAAGCHEPEELIPSIVGAGLNSVTAQFASGEYKDDAQARFTATVSADQERIVIDIPYYFPESTTNQVDITAMRVSASLDDNCFLTPKLGTLDLTQEHSFTLTRADGSTKKITITGNVKKSDKCLLETFTLPSLGLSGVIDQAKSEVSIIALGELAPAKAEYQLSYHATISPDPAVEELDYNEDVKLTVTAFDGVTKKTYTVKKNVPGKTKSGIREGSQKNLFVSETFKQQWGMSGTLNYTMGVMGDYLVVCSGESEAVYVNKLTGVKAGDVNMNGIDLKNGTSGGGAIASDDAGHLVMCTNATAGMNMEFYTLDDVRGVPQHKLTWKNTSGGRMGQHISVRGDITGNALVTVNCWAWALPANWSSFVRIRVENGVWGEPEKVTIMDCGKWNGGNVDVEYLTTDTSGPYFKASYSTNGLEWIDGATDTRVAFIDKGANDGNSNFSNVSCLYFNGKPYVAVYGGSHFNYSATRAMMFDASDRNAFTGTFDDTAAKYYYSTPKYLSNLAGTASCDVLLCQSADGYFLYLYWLGGNTGFVRAEQFDCIEQQ